MNKKIRKSLARKLTGALPERSLFAVCYLSASFFGQMEAYRESGASKRADRQVCLHSNTIDSAKSASRNLAMESGGYVDIPGPNVKHGFVYFSNRCGSEGGFVLLQVSARSQLIKLESG